MTSGICSDYAETIAFLRDMWLSETAPKRPGLVMNQHVGLDDPGYDPRIVHPLVPTRVRNGDDYVPQVDTSNGPNAMVSAFGTGEQMVGGHWIDKVLSDISEVAGLPKPTVNAGLVGEAIDRTVELRNTTEVTIRSLDLQSPLTVATQILGVSEVFVAMYDDPKRLHNLLELLTDFTIDVVEAQRKAADGRFAPVYWPGIWSPDEVGLELSDDYMLSLSPEQFDEFSLPCISRLAEHFGGIFLHSCSIYDRNLPSLAKIPNLRGVNSDLSMSAPIREILDAIPGVVYSPHIYMNKEISRPSQAAWLKEILDAWRPGDRLFPCVLGVIYDDSISGEQMTDFEDIRSVWKKAGWK